MGKTAQIIALLLAKPGDFGTLVVSPQHLCFQWRNEIAKFAGNHLKVFLCSTQSQLLSLHRSQYGPNEVVVLSLELITGLFGDLKYEIAQTRKKLIEAQKERESKQGKKSKEITPKERSLVNRVVELQHQAELNQQSLTGKTTLLSMRWHRLVLDECHDAVLLNGGTAMSTLLSIKADRSWCVSGTPFPEGDRSVFGIHQILGININFVLSDGPFRLQNKPLPGSTSTSIATPRIYIFLSCTLQSRIPFSS